MCRRDEPRVIEQPGLRVLGHPSSLIFEVEVHDDTNRREHHGNRRHQPHA